MAGPLCCTPLPCPPAVSPGICTWDDTPGVPAEIHCVTQGEAALRISTGSAGGQQVPSELAGVEKRSHPVVAETREAEDHRFLESLAASETPLDTWERCRSTIGSFR